MIKVLQIGMSYTMGGIERFILNHYYAIDRSKYKFDFISMFDTIAGKKEIETLGGTIYSVVNAKKNPILCCRQIKKIIDQNEYDAIHIHLASFSNPIPLLAASLSNCENIIIHSHNNGISTGLRKFICHNISKVTTSKMKIERLACSKSAGEFMFGRTPFDVFENAIPVEQFTYEEEKRNHFRNQLEIEDHSYVIGTVGRLDPQKNHSFLIHVFSEYLKMNPDSYLLIVGGGRLEEQLHALTYDLNIDSKVIFTGFQEDVSPYYQAMDVFCLPSLYEGLGIVGIEAQKCGLPCIFSNYCVEEVNISGKATYIPLNIDEWLSAIASYYQLQNLWDRKEQSPGYDVKENVKKLEYLYARE